MAFVMTTYEGLYKDIFENNNLKLMENYVQDNIPIYYKGKAYTFGDVKENVKNSFNIWTFEKVEAYSVNNRIVVACIPVYNENSYFRVKIEFEMSGIPGFKKLKAIYIKDELSAYILLGQEFKPTCITKKEVIKGCFLDNSVADKNFRLELADFSTYFTLFLNKDELEAVLNEELPYTTPSTTEREQIDIALKLTGVTNYKTIGRIYYDTFTYKSFLRSEDNRAVFLKANLYYITMKKSDAAYIGGVFPEKLEILNN